MQDTAHAAGAPTAHQGGPLEDPLEQASPRSRMRASIRRAPPRSRGCAYLEQAPPRSRARPPSIGLRLARGSALPLNGVRLARGRPHACARARAQAFNALTTAGRRHHAPGARAPVPPHQLPRRDPIPATVGGTVRRGRCQSRDTAPPTPVRLTR
jgi:hypothetical protein